MGTEARRIQEQMEYHYSFDRFSGIEEHIDVAAIERNGRSRSLRR